MSLVILLLFALALSAAMTSSPLGRAAPCGYALAPIPFHAFDPRVGATSNRPRMREIRAQHSGRYSVSGCPLLAKTI